jgi:WD40 repeat protein
MKHGVWLYAIACSPDGSRVFSAGQGHSVACWDLKTGKRIGSLGKHKQRIAALAVSPDGTRLLSGSDDTTLLVWQLK